MRYISLILTLLSLSLSCLVIQAGTSMSSAATVTPSAIVTFSTIDQLICTSTSIIWFYLHGPRILHELDVTNLNVPQSG
jgi:hypothetical protein